MPRDHGGRSSATPNENLIIPPEREVSPRSPLRRPHRKRPVHFPTVTVGFKSIIIFLTVCTRQRKPLLANDEAARLMIKAWQAANFWRVGRYVIMPDHIHLFCAPNTFPNPTAQELGQFLAKSCDTKVAARNQIPILQRDYWDRQLRRNQSRYSRASPSLTVPRKSRRLTEISPSIRNLPFSSMVMSLISTSG